MLKSVSRSKPCLVCGHHAGCSKDEEGLMLCRRTEGNQEGFRWLGVSKRNPEWHLYRLFDDPIGLMGSPKQYSAGVPSSRPVFSKPETQPIDLQAEAERYRENLTPARRAYLARMLELPVKALDCLPMLGYIPERNKYTVPEVDAKGKVIGIFLKGKNFRGCMTGHKRGLTIPVGWQDRPGPVRIVEGFSDVLALYLKGLPVIGRPSAMVGGNLLVDLLRPTGRPVRIIQENDQKPNGHWPGKEGAEHIQRQLVAAGIETSIVPMPAGFKDPREWVSSKLRRPVVY